MEIYISMFLGNSLTNFQKGFSEKSQPKHNSTIYVKYFQQQLRYQITWLKSIGYHSIFTSPEYLTKAVRRLPNYLRQRFHNHRKSIFSSDSFIRYMKRLFGVSFYPLFPHLDRIRRDTGYLSAFNPNTSKYRPEKLRVKRIFK